ncbi:MAG: adenylate/guanylate cyclase domain-containing protein [Betaproteobacteria bacterium]
MLSYCSRLSRSSVVVIALVALCASAIVASARGVGLFESMELVAYDAFMRLRYADVLPDSRITLITVTENDIRNNGGPLSDEVLARALEAVLRYQPRAIGLDIYRDVPVAPGTQKLEALLAAEPRLIVVTKSAEGRSGGVPPPRALQSTERAGFSDVLVDRGGVVRRGLLFLNDETTTSYAFSLRLALQYLQAHGVIAQPDPNHPSFMRLGAVTIAPLEADDGGYVRADAHGYQFLLDFKGAPRPFHSIELVKLLAGAAEPELLNDKIVIIGVIAESVGDVFYTPWSRGPDAQQSMPGVVVQAHIASQLLRMGLQGEAPIAPLPKWQEWLWLIVWSTAGALLGITVRSPLRFSLAVAAGVIAVCVFAFLAFLRGWWIPLVPPGIAWLMSAGLMATVVSHRESLQRTLLMRLFSRHVSREVAEAIWQQREQFLDGERPRSVRLVATVMFTDLTRFTGISEQLTPEALLDWLNECMDAMTREVSRYGGVIRQYAGDAIVAVFGIPIARRTEAEIDQDAYNAVSCALAMETALVELNRRWRSQSRPTTEMRIGIFTGPVVAGTLGSAERSEYVVVGDTVNTAATLEGFDKELFMPENDSRPARILIGEPTLDRIGARFEIQDIGNVSLKGKEQPVRVYRVIGQKADSAGDADGVR